MRQAFEQGFDAQLAERAARGDLRTLRTWSTGIDLLSNDYLGWARSRVIDRRVEELLAGSSSSVSGSTDSRLLGGNDERTEQLELEIARVHGTEAALLFNSGYMANLGLVPAVCDRHTTILSDALCHASLIDATRLAVKAGHEVFKHNDLDDLEAKLVRSTGRKLVLVESTYSMDGDEAPLAAMVELCRKHDAVMVVDEAHALGVLGPDGLGLVGDAAWNDVVLARVYTYGKAMACHGAAVVGSDLLRRYLVNKARTFIYTTAAPPHQVASIAAAYEALKADRTARPGLTDLIAYFRDRIATSRVQGFIPSRSAVQCLVLGDNDKALALAERLGHAGFRTKAILRPTVPPGGERIRFCLHAFNTQEEIDLLFKHLAA